MWVCMCLYTVLCVHGEHSGQAVRSFAQHHVRCMTAQGACPGSGDECARPRGVQCCYCVLQRLCWRLWPRPSFYVGLDLRGPGWAQGVSLAVSPMVGGGVPASGD